MAARGKHFAGMPVARNWWRRANTARSMRRCIRGGSMAERMQQSVDTMHAGQSLRTGISPRRSTSFAPCGSVLLQGEGGVRGSHSPTDRAGRSGEI